VFSAVHSMTEDAAREVIEKMRWPNGPVCPHCGATKIYTLKPKPTSTRPVRKGVYKCAKCRRQFTVTVKTVFEDSHIQLRVWLSAISLICCSKKGISALQLQRMLGISYRSAWFMAHRVRYAMSQPPLKEKLKGVVEVDETYFGAKRPMHRKMENKSAIFALVQRGGTIRPIASKRIVGKDLHRAMREMIDPSAHLMTDQHLMYRPIGKEFAKHDTIRHHLNEYVRGNVHTNTVEGFFGLLKRGVIGTYHSVGQKHLQRYADEFAFRYNTRRETDLERAQMAIRATEGKRLMYKEPMKKK